MKEDKMEIRILYVEDDPLLFDPWLRFICETWGEVCRGSRSREGALQLMEEEGFTPDLVILDRSILFYEEDEVDSWKAGDSLYYYLCNRGIKAVVCSGDDLERVEPYASRKPVKIVSKPFDKNDLRQAVEKYVSERNG